MPGRSNRDDKQTPPAPPPAADAPEPGSFSSVLHQFGKSLGLVHDDPPPPPPPPAAAPKAVLPVADTVAKRGKVIDKAVDDASK